MAVDIVGSILLVALGFAPTFAALEAAWRMGKMIGKRGEPAVAAAAAAAGARKAK